MTKREEQMFHAMDVAIQWIDDALRQSWSMHHRTQSGRMKKARKALADVYVPMLQAEEEREAEEVTLYTTPRERIHELVEEWATAADLSDKEKLRKHFKLEEHIDNLLGSGDNGEAPSERERRQRGIIEAVEEWAEMSEISVLLLGTDSDRHIYADAILGTITTPRPAVLYSREKVIEAMVRESDFESGGGTWEEMEEFYEYNTVRGLQYMREEDNPPIMVDGVAR